VVSIFVSRVLSGEPITIFGDGEQTRDYVFVQDVARASVLAATRSDVSRGARLDVPAFNIATGTETTVNALARHVMSALGREVPVEYAPSRPGELMRSCLDIGKADRELDWRPKVQFDEGLQALATWFQGVR
jgi:UDP-glucose 4-epimerase